MSFLRNYIFIVCILYENTFRYFLCKKNSYSSLHDSKNKIIHCDFKMFCLALFFKDRLMRKYKTFNNMSYILLIKSKTELNL